MGGGAASLKWTYVTRIARDTEGMRVGAVPARIRRGDLVVGRVSRIGMHSYVEDRCGRRARLYRGDHVVVACVDRRGAHDAFEAVLPQGTEAHLLTAGGLVGTVRASPEASAALTALAVVGALVDAAGRPLCCDDFARPVGLDGAPPLGSIAVVGSGASSGRTTTGTALVRGWVRAGLLVGAGTTCCGTGKDRWAYLDAGAHAVADLLDFGVPSSSGYSIERLAGALLAVRSDLVHEGAEVVVIEAPEPLSQPENYVLVERMAGLVDAVVLAAVDLASARSAAALLADLGLPLAAVSGVVTRSPLAAREVAAAIEVPVLSPRELAAGAAVHLLRRRAGSR